VHHTDPASSPTGSASGSSSDVSPQLAALVGEARESAAQALWLTTLAEARAWAEPDELPDLDELAALPRAEGIARLREVAETRGALGQTQELTILLDEVEHPRDALV
jgi:hypothetical protein